MNTDKVRKNFNGIKETNIDDIIAKSPFFEGQEFFERAIEIGTPKEHLLLMYNVSNDEMNKLCEYWYGKGRSFDEVYKMLTSKGIIKTREMFNNLAQQGNSASINVVSRDRKIGDGLTTNDDNEIGVLINFGKFKKD